MFSALLGPDKRIRPTAKGNSLSNDREVEDQELNFQTVNGVLNCECHSQLLKAPLLICFQINHGQEHTLCVLGSPILKKKVHTVTVCAFTVSRGSLPLNGHISFVVRAQSN